MLLQTKKYKCVFMVLSQNFCAWTICKHLCDIVLFGVLGRVSINFSLMFDFFFLICTSALESFPFVLFRFFFPVSLFIILDFWKLPLWNWSQITPNYLKWTQMISQFQNIWWIFIVLSQKFCAWTFCKQLCDIIFLQKSIDIFFWKHWQNKSKVI